MYEWLKSTILPKEFDHFLREFKKIAFHRVVWGLHLEEYATDKH